MWFERPSRIYGSHPKEAALSYSPQEASATLSKGNGLAFGKVNGKYYFGGNHTYITYTMTKDEGYTWEDMFTIPDQVWGWLWPSETLGVTHVALVSGDKGQQDQSQMPVVAQELSSLLGIEAVPLLKEASLTHWRWIYNPEEDRLHICKTWWGHAMMAAQLGLSNAEGWADGLENNWNWYGGFWFPAQKKMPPEMYRPLGPIDEERDAQVRLLVQERILSGDYEELGADPVDPVTARAAAPHGSHKKEAAESFTDKLLVKDDATLRRIWSPEEVKERLASGPVVNQAFGRIGGKYYFGYVHPYIADALAAEWGWEQLMAQPQQWGWLWHYKGDTKLIVELMSGTFGEQDKADEIEIQEELSEILLG